MKNSFQQAFLTLVTLIAGGLMYWALDYRFSQDAERKDPCYYAYFKVYDNNKSRFAYCINKELRRAASQIKYYLKFLPKDINFTSEEEHVIEKGRMFSNSLNELK
nr:hypothetical protein [uncultured Campylobacter sp.]